MNYSEMSLVELKEYAKKNGISVGNSGREKLIEKIKEKEVVDSVFNDDDNDYNIDEFDLDDINSTIDKRLFRTFYEVSNE